TLGVAQGDTGPNRAEPEGNGPPKGRAKSLAAFGAVVDNNWGGGMTDGREKAAPGEGEFSPGPCVPGYRGIGGNADHIIQQSKAKGRRTGRYRAPFSSLKVPHHPEGEDRQ